MAEPTLFDLPGGPMDDHTAAVVDIVDTDDLGDYDRDLIDDAVRRVAMRHNRRVSTNDVRKALTGEDGLVVRPQRIGPRLAALTRAGVLAWDGEWDTNTDRAGRNTGKVQKLRRYVGDLT